MARYSSNFRNKLQKIVELGKEYGFTSNFDMPRPFTSSKLSYRAKWRTANQIAERSLVSRSRGRVTNSLWGRPVYTMPAEFENGIKKCRFGLPFTRCRQNFVSVNKTAKFVILPFSNSVGIV